MSINPIVLLHTDTPATTEAIVRKHHPDLDIHTCDTYKDLPHKLAQTRAEVVYSVRFDGTPQFPGDELVNSKHVKWVSVGGSGTDHLPHWSTRQLTVTNAAGVAADVMAEYVLGCLLSFRLSLRDFHRAQQQQEWKPANMVPLHGSTALIVGLGKTGCAVAARLKSLGVYTLGTRARVQSTPFVDEVHTPDKLHNLIPRADAVICTLPLLDSTRNILSTREFALFKTNAILIDVSRGGVVDNAALLPIVSEGRIAGAALDVFYQEPLPQQDPLWQLDNVIITPHCSSVYDGWQDKSAELFATNLTRYLAGDKLNNIVDPARGY